VPIVLFVGDAGSGGGIGGTEPSSVDRAGKAVEDAFGVVERCPQFGHFALTPALLAGTLRRFPHVGQAKRIMLPPAGVAIDSPKQ